MNKMCMQPKLRFSYPFYFGEKAIAEMKVPPRVECGTCGRRVKPYLVDCEYPHLPHCFHITIPPHKVKGWWKKGKKANNRDRGGRSV
jgi:hypothetical protein